MRPLVIPPAAQRDEHAVQMLSAWIAENGLHCSMNVGMWRAEGVNESVAWGILLADVVRHLANAIQSEHGVHPATTVESIADALIEELNKPSSEATGGFHPGHA